jgi:hypothetical protein
MMEDLRLSVMIGIDFFTVFIGGGILLKLELVSGYFNKSIILSFE